LVSVVVKPVHTLGVPPNVDAGAGTTVTTVVAVQPVLNV
jgi:hypothetical protein